MSAADRRHIGHDGAPASSPCCRQGSHAAPGRRQRSPELGLADTEPQRSVWSGRAAGVQSGTALIQAALTFPSPWPRMPHSPTTRRCICLRNAPSAPRKCLRRWRWLQDTIVLHGSGRLSLRICFAGGGGGVETHTAASNSNSFDIAKRRNTYYETGERDEHRHAKPINASTRSHAYEHAYATITLAVKS